MGVFPNVAGVGLTAAIAAIVIAACGSSSHVSSTTASGQATSPTPATAASARSSQSQQSQAPVKPPPGPTPKRIPTPVPKTGDRSIQTYGRPATNAEFIAIANTVRGFNLAIASRNLSTACALLATTVSQDLARVYAHTVKSGAQHPSCQHTLSVFVRIPTGAYANQLRSVQVTDARVKGSNGFAIYHQSRTPVSAIPVLLEGQNWKVAGLAGVPLQ